MPTSRRALALLTPLLVLGCEASTTPVDVGEAPALQSNGVPLQHQEVTVCKTGPEGGFATFSVQATGGALPLGAEVTVTAVKPQGVFPAACASVWRSTGPDPQSVTITEVDTSPHTGLAEIAVLGGGSSDLGAKTATVQVTDQVGGLVVFKGEALNVESVQVGTAGGTFSLADGTLALDIPAGALGEGVLITASPYVGPLPPDGPPIVPGTAWDFGPDGLVFDEPVWLTISYDPTLIPPGVDESALRIHKLIDGELVQMDAGLVDPVNHTITARIEGFSIYLVLPRTPGTDITPPRIDSILVAADGGPFERTASVDVSAADQVVRVRVFATDNSSGIQLANTGSSYVFSHSYHSPSGAQQRSCPSHTLVSGSDTNGVFECLLTIRQFSEPGTTVPRIIALDNARNLVSYSPVTVPGSICPRVGTNPCLPFTPEITVTSDPSDTTPPWISDAAVSLDTTPRSFGLSASVDLLGGPQRVIARVHVEDDLSGAEGVSPSLIGPGGAGNLLPFTCTLAGTTLAGDWECLFFLDPATTAGGTWTLGSVGVTDRLRNRGGSSLEPGGQLCGPVGCVPAPTIEVLSPLNDTEEPTLVSVSLSAVGADVTVVMQVFDSGAGVESAGASFTHLESLLRPGCQGVLQPPGTLADGQWSCTVTFPDSAPPGDWALRVFVVDRGRNTRDYYRRASDGFLCYTPNDGGPAVCQDFGVTLVEVAP